MNAGINNRLGIALGLAVFAPGVLSAQSFLDQFSYEGLRFTGIGIEIGAIGSDRVTTEVSPALRIDYGFIAPNLRVLIGGSYFRGAFQPEEIAALEQQLRGVVVDPTQDFVIDIGEITWSTVEADLDLQYLFPGRTLTTYLGLGLGAHLRDGDGQAIAGTFLEDALDTIQAGLNLSLGAAIALLPRLQLTVDVRGSLTSELRTAAARGGLMYRFPTARAR